MENILYHLFRDSDYMHACSEGEIDKSLLISFLDERSDLKIDKIKCYIEMYEDLLTDYYSAMVKRSVLRQYDSKKAFKLKEQFHSKNTLIEAIKTFYKKYFEKKRILFEFVEIDETNNLLRIDPNLAKDIIKDSKNYNIFVIHCYNGNFKYNFKSHKCSIDTTNGKFDVNFIINPNELNDEKTLKNYKFDTDLFGFTINKGLAQFKFQKALKKINLPGDGQHGIITNDYDFENEISFAAFISDQKTSVLIRGETGTGKELIANYIHKSSNRKDKPFIAVNCAAIPEALFESEMFGYTKGAYTGAFNSKKGTFEIVNGGTLFLDEIGDLSLSNQTKLLRVLEIREVTPIGSNISIPVDFRLITATHKNLVEEISKDNFRSDLYYRIENHIINLKPLRDRGKKDIEALVKYFISDIKESSNKYYNIEFSDDAIDLISNYYWPGNIRQLRSFIIKVFYKTAFSYYNKESKFYYDEPISPDQKKYYSIESDRYVYFDEYIIIDKENVKKCLNLYKSPEENDINAVAIEQKKENKEFPDNFYNLIENIEFKEKFNLDELLLNTEKKFLTKALKIKKGNITKAGNFVGYKQSRMQQKITKWKLLDR